MTHNRYRLANTEANKRDFPAASPPYVKRREHGLVMYRAATWNAALKLGLRGIKIRSWNFNGTWVAGRKELPV